MSKNWKTSGKVIAITAAQVCAQVAFLSQAFATPQIDPGVVGSGAISSLEKSNGEVCIIPATVPEMGKGVASKKQTELCAIDFYNDPKTAICAKQFSTNPAIEPYAIPDGTTKLDFETKDCAIPEKKRPGKKLAKFKSTITCSDTSSILSYYEISSILGGIGMVPPTVFRTMDLSEHLKIANHAKNGPLSTSWKEFAERDLTPASFPSMYTKDARFVYGALSENPGGDSPYTEFVGHRINYADGFHAFSQTPLYLAVTSSAPPTVPKTLAGAAQEITAMKDMSDMILLDTLLNQQDRFGNEAKQAFYIWVDETGKLQEQSQKKADASEMKTKGAVLVNKLLMKDNDCGVSKTNWMLKNHSLASLRHMSARTYHLFMNFANSIKAEPEKFRDYFQSQMIYTPADWASVSANIESSRVSLLTNCQNHKLSLDLDLDRYLGLSSDASVTCD